MIAWLWRRKPAGRSWALMDVRGRVSFSVQSMGVLTQHLKNPSILKSENLDSRENFFPVTNPADPESVLARVSAMGKDETKLAIERADAALAFWRDGTTGSYRGNLLRAWSQAMADHAHDVATIMTLECGKPLKESLGEVSYARSYLDYYAAEAMRPSGAGGGFLIPTTFTKPDPSGSPSAPKGQMFAIQQAIGVTASITPWNFPAAMITRSVGPALAAGCVTILKPSELTPLTALALRNLASDVGIPDHVFQVVTADRDVTPEVAGELCSSTTVRQLHFTGSTVVGKWLYEHCSSTMKRLSLELGGNAPFVVFEDADIDQAVNAAMACKFRNAGQACISADRFLIHESVHDEFVDKLSTRVSALRLGSGMDRSTDIGPLITAHAATRLEDKVQSAVQEGATLMGGGNLRRWDLGSHFFQPTILTNVPIHSLLWSTETFGPVVSIRSFSTDDEALSIANDCRVGLAGYFFSRNLSRIFSFAQRLECGMVGINEGTISSCAAPFGGVKESGLGREGSPLGITEYLETKYVFLNA